MSDLPGFPSSQIPSAKDEEGEPSGCDSDYEDESAGAAPTTQDPGSLRKMLHRMIALLLTIVMTTKELVRTVKLQSTVLTTLSTTTQIPLMK
ncbi:hypothetical protein PR002_g10430 [Phytophthora rubi]|uniref:Uncharacterized protein n=1 Tax=Phytophthora rubi TaxID=129364 RepID=A0A6A3M7W1_9STRA|nr:hypothetical protein PR002_g10430 [Phytophthora rubi]